MGLLVPLFVAATAVGPALMETPSIEKTEIEASQEASLELALQAREEGSFAKAEALLEELGSKDPEDFRYPLELAITYWWDLQAKEALKSITRAQLLAERSDAAHLPGILQVRGRILLALKRYEQAIVALNRSIGLEPKTPSHIAARGTVYRAQRNRSQAREDYERALALDPDCEEAQLGLEALKSTWRNEVTMTVRASAIRSKEPNAEQSWNPGGEIYARHFYKAEEFAFARVTQQLPRWGDPGGPGAADTSASLSRVEAGALLAPAEGFKLGVSSLVTFSAAPTHYAVLLDGSLQRKKNIFLASLRPGVDARGGLDTLLQGGVQRLFGKKWWGMAQVFQYFSAPKHGPEPQRSTTGVLTLAVDPNPRLTLRAGGGAGIYPAGFGYPAFGSVLYHHDRWSLGLNYEFFGGFFTQHQLSSCVGLWF